MFGTQTTKARSIRMYLNGDVNNKGAALLVHDTKFKTMEQVIAFSF